MTHDELLAKIEDNYWIDKPQESLGYSSPEAWSALRAVVELHKEATLITGYSHDKTYQLKQQVCLNCTDLAGKPIPYPCFNIQAIEKELG